MARVKHEIRLDLSGVDLAALRSVADFRRVARELLPAALEALGRTLGQAAWVRLQARADGVPDDPRAFVAEAGRKYRRHAPEEERRALEDLIIWRLQRAKAKATDGTKKQEVTVPLKADRPSIAAPPRHRAARS